MCDNESKVYKPYTTNSHARYTQCSICYKVCENADGVEDCEGENAQCQYCGQDII